MFNKNNYFIDRTIKHIRKVQDNMIYLEENKYLLSFKVKEFELLRRSLKHDLSKFSKNLINGYIDLTEYYYNKDNNISNNHINIDKIRNVADIHCNKEKHHPNNKIKMSNIDLCEMCSDLAAMSFEKNEDNYTDYFLNKQIKNFKFLEKYKNKILNILLILENFDKNHNYK